MTLDLLLLQIFTGLALGSILVLMAIGMSLIFGMLTVANFAHGAFYMVGAYAGIVVFQLTNSFLAAVVVAPLAVGAMGMVVEWSLVRPLYGRGLDYPIVLTFGLAYAMVEITRILFGKEGIPFETPELLQGAVYLGFGYFPVYRLFLIGVCIVVVLALYLGLEKTRFGLVVRAGATDPEIVRILGIDIRRLWMLIFGLGTGLAALAGLLAAPVRGVTPEMGIPVLVEALVVTVVGGMGSLLGASVAGLLVGVVMSLTSLFSPKFAELSMFALMALTLIVRPRGLFGRPGQMG
jgi:branched-chain amino acid transport system permease protein